jgi:hypothetical protein
MTTARFDYPPQRDFTEQQWRDIIAELPNAPTNEARRDLIVAANVYWEVRAALNLPLKEQRRLVAEAVDHLRAGMENIRVAAPQFQSQLTPLSRLLANLVEYRDLLEGIPNHSAATLRKSRREEFLDAALKLWLDCGGNLQRSRSPREPTGPLIRYLTVVSDIVMGEDALAPESLAAFVRERRKR